MKASAIPQYVESSYKLEDVVVKRHKQPNDNFFQVRMISVRGCSQMTPPYRNVTAHTNMGNNNFA